MIHGGETGSICVVRPGSSHNEANCNKCATELRAVTLFVQESVQQALAMETVMPPLHGEHHGPRQPTVYCVSILIG